MAYIFSMRCRNPVPDKRRCDGELKTAHRLFERFHSFAPPELTTHRCSRELPRVMVKLGELRGLIYRSDKEQCGRPRTFIHFMETPPMLTCDPAGRQLYIVGGDYRVTRLGIEG